MPLRFETHPVAICIHALPKSRVFVKAKLAVGGTSFKRIAFENAVCGVREVPKEVSLEAEKATVDETLA